MKKINPIAVDYSSNSAARCAPTLCWDCARACGGGNCEWAEKLKPISGWIVESASTSPSHSVLYCPKFVRGSSADDIRASEYNNNETNSIQTHEPSKVICRPGCTEPKGIPGYRYTCPLCEAVFGYHTGSCPTCGVRLLWHSFLNKAGHQGYRSGEEQTQ